MKWTFTLIGCLVLFGGCSEPKMADMGPPQKPKPSPEIARLNKLIGTWEGDATMIEPAMPEGQNTFKGGGTWIWDMGGMYLKSEGWHEMGPDVRVKMVEYWTWDPKMKKYHTWYFSDWGECGEGWLTMSEDGKHMKFKGEGMSADGSRSKGHGTMTFVDNDTLEWTWSERRAGEKMEFKGVSKRQ